jgi:hypothetical protein
MKKELLLPAKEKLVSSIETATQALQRARQSFRSTEIVVADALDKRALKIQADFAVGLDSKDPQIENSSNALEESLRRAARRQAILGEMLFHGLHELAVREIVEAVNMLPTKSCYRKDIPSEKTTSERIER